MTSAAAYGRVVDRLPAATSIELVTMIGSDFFIQGSQLIAREDVDPEVFWISLDLWRSGGLPAFLAKIHSGTRGRWAQSFAAGFEHPSFRTLLDKGLRLTKSEMCIRDRLTLVFGRQVTNFG